MLVYQYINKMPKSSFTKDLNRMFLNSIETHSNNDDFIFSEMFCNTSSKMIERDLYTNKSFHKKKLFNN